MERALDLLYNDLPMSSLAIQFGLIGVVAAVAGVLWHRLARAVHGPDQLQAVPPRSRWRSAQPSG
jgi:hypothetical protein